MKTKNAKAKCATKKEVPIKKTLLIPSVSILTLDEFNEIPKYMKGILHLCSAFVNFPSVKFPFAPLLFDPFFFMYRTFAI